MGTQGIVSVVKDGVTRIKIVAGCDGQNAIKVATWLRDNPGSSPQQAFEISKKFGLGGTRDLIVQFSPTEYLASDCIDGIFYLYKEKFLDPKFNPRWESGTADHVEIVEETSDNDELRSHGLPVIKGPIPPMPKVAKPKEEGAAQYDLISAKARIKKLEQALQQILLNSTDDTVEEIANAALRLA